MSVKVRRAKELSRNPIRKSVLQCSSSGSLTRVTEAFLLLCYVSMCAVHYKNRRARDRGKKRLKTGKHNVISLQGPGLNGLRSSPGQRLAG